MRMLSFRNAMFFLEMCTKWLLRSSISCLIFITGVESPFLLVVLDIDMIVTQNFGKVFVYNVLAPKYNGTFPWKSIWKPKVSPRVYFFIWIVALDKLLTADNLRKWNISLISWCCMCQADGETIDHLFLHCPVAREMWAAVFNLYGMSWVMPRRVIDLLACW